MIWKPSPQYMVASPADSSIRGGQRLYSQSLPRKNKGPNQS